MPVSATDVGPSGTIPLPADVFLEGGPDLWYGGVAKYSPDTDGFYWGITGTPANPARKLGCYTQFRFRDNVQISDVRCDTVGVISTIQKRNYLEADFTLMSLLSLAQIRVMLRGGPVTQNSSEHTEKMGLGIIDNNSYFMTYFSKVYDTVAGSFVSVTAPRSQFVDAWEIAANYGGDICRN